MIDALRLVILVEKPELRSLGDKVAAGVGQVLNVEPVVRWYRGPSPSSFVDPRRGQCNAELILRELTAKYKVSGLERILVLLDRDGFVEGLNFVFGIAKSGWGGIVFLERLRPEFYGRPPSPRLFESRVTKVSLHELGHSFGLGHCTNNRCVMWFDNTVYEVDAKTSRFCAWCTLALEYAYPGLVKIYG